MKATVGSAAWWRMARQRAKAWQTERTVIVTWHDHQGDLWEGGPESLEDFRTLAHIDVVAADVKAGAILSHVRLRVAPDESTFSGGH